jgi:tetratricopeptide (TPR) repeat protein
MKRLNLLAAAVLAVLVLGCAHHDGGANGSSGSDSFGTMKEPPISAGTHFAAGQLAESEGRLPQAIEQYKLALSADPKHLDSLYRLGVVYAQSKDFSQAIQSWNRYIELTGGSATAYSNLGFCQELAGNPPGAEAAYQKGIAREPRNEPCRVNYGLMLARQGRTSEGLRQLQFVLAPAQAHYDLAGVFQVLGKRQEARAEYQRAIDLDPQFQDAREKLAALN